MTSVDSPTPANKMDLPAKLNEIAKKETTQMNDVGGGALLLDNRTPIVFAIAPIPQCALDKTPKLCEPTDGVRILPETPPALGNSLVAQSDPESESSQRLHDGGDDADALAATP